MKKLIIQISIIALLFQACNSFNKSSEPEIKLFPYQVDGKTGYFDVTGKIVLLIRNLMQRFCLKMG